jgi:hypothetical protein
LNAGHLIGTYDVPAHRCQEGGIGIARADRLDLGGKGRGIIGFGFGSEPVAAAMGLEIGLSLKNAPPRWAKSQAQSGV